jgi:hypothetical protein
MRHIEGENIGSAKENTARFRTSDKARLFLKEYNKDVEQRIRRATDDNAKPLHGTTIIYESPLIQPSKPVTTTDLYLLNPVTRIHPQAQVNGPLADVATEMLQQHNEELTKNGITQQEKNGMVDRSLQRCQTEHYIKAMSSGD